AFVHLGAAGLDLGDGTQSAVVQGCVFNDISGSGLQLGDVDIAQTSATRELTRHNRISDNWFHALPVEYHGGVGIFVGYAQDSTIPGNVLYHHFHGWAGRHTDTTAGNGNYDPEDIEHNWWQGGDPPSSAKGVTLAHNQLITGPGGAPASIVDNAGLEPAYRGL